MRNSSNIDQVDFSIIRALQQDSRKPYTDIAKSLGIAESTVRYRVSRLLAENTLRLGATFDFIKLGFNASAFMSIRVQANSFDEVAESLKTIPEVSYLLATSGDFDLLAELTCRDREHLMHTIKQIRNINAIVTTSTQMILQVYKELLPSLGLDES